MTETNKSKSIYERGAEDGAWMGLCCVAVFVTAVVSVNHPSFSLLSFMLMVLVPVLTYVFLRRTYVSGHGLISFAALWMQGIVMFGGAFLIFGLCSYVYLQWIEPEFISNIIVYLIDVYKSQPGEAAASLAGQLQDIVDTHAVPDAMQLTLSWMWLGVFSGSLLSMVIAGLVRLKKV